MRCFRYIFVILLNVLAGFIALQIRQEGAVIKTCNPKYVTDCYTITKRIKRGEPYMTNYSVTTLHYWNNNVTFKTLLYPEGFGEIVILKLRLCDGMKVTWIMDFFKTFANQDFVCPVKPGSYKLYNIELPPKNLPQSIAQLLKGQFNARFIFEITKTEETIIESAITLHDVKQN